MRQDIRGRREAPRRPNERKRLRISTGLTGRNAMIEEFDIDNDGEINMEEFLAIMLDGE
jgi:hypothetical protein